MKTKKWKLLLILLSVVVTVVIAIPIRNYENVVPDFLYRRQHGIPFEFMTVHRVMLQESVSFRIDYPFGFSVGMYSYGVNINLLMLLLTGLVVFFVLRLLSKYNKHIQN